MDQAERKASRTAAQIAREQKQRAKEVEQAWQNIGLAIGGGLTLAATAAAAFFRQTLTTIDGIKSLAEATGSAVENVSALEDIARRTGGSLADVESVLVKFNQTLKDADPKKGAGAVLKALNLDIAELKRLDPSEALRQTAIALEGFADNGDKARAVQELFGKSVKDAAPFLKDLAEAGKLQGTITTEAAEEVDRFNKELARLQAGAADVGRSLSIDLVTSLNRVIDRMNEARASGKGFWETQSAGYWQWVRDFWGVQEEVKKAFQPVFSPDDQSAAEMQRLIRQAQRPSLVIPDAPTKTPRGPRAPREAPFTGVTYDERIAQSVGSLLEGTEVARAKELADQIAYLDKLFFDAGLSADLYDSAMEKLTGSTSSAKDQVSQFIQEQERLAQLLGATPTAALEAQRQDMLLLAKAYEEGRISVEQYLEAVGARLGTMPTDIKKANDAARELGMTFSSAFEDAIVGGKGVSDVLEGLYQDLLRIGTRKLVTEPLADALGDIFKGMSGGGAGGFFDFFAGIFGGFRANGGPVFPGQLYRVNENGPEMLEMSGRQYLMMGNKSGNVVPSGSGMRVTNNFTIQGPVDRRTELQIAQAAGRGIQTAMSRNG